MSAETLDSLMTSLDRVQSSPPAENRPAQRRPRILVVEDDAVVATIVSRYLLREGYEVEAVNDGLSALARTAVGWPDLVVLDLTLPAVDGLEVCRRIRATAALPIIIVSARGKEADRVTGLDCGADDYLPKPFSPRELMARVRSVLRRAASLQISAAPQLGQLRSSSIMLDERAREVRVRGELVETAPREFDLLAFFMRHPRVVLQRETLLKEVWGYSFGGTATVTVHVRRLREKVEPDASNPTHIRTVWRVGYRFEP